MFSLVKKIETRAVQMSEIAEQGDKAARSSRRTPYETMRKSL